MIRKVYKIDGFEFNDSFAIRQYLGSRPQNAIIFGEEPTENLSEFWENLGVEYSEEEIQPSKEDLANEIRLKRNELLAESDFYVMPDYPSTPEGLTLVKSYRKLLRNITDQEGFPTKVYWPTLPMVLDTSNENDY